MKEYYDMGYDFLNCSADVVAINADCNAVLKRMPEPWKTFDRKTADSLVLFRYSLNAGLRLKSGLF